MNTRDGKILTHAEEEKLPVILVSRKSGSGRTAQFSVEMNCTDDDMLLGIKMILKERMRWLSKNEFMFNINDEAHTILSLLAEAGRELEFEESKQ